MTAAAATARSERETVSVEYLAPLTLAAFMASDAFVRMVIGPVGSGKSSACVMEILARAMEQVPGPDGLRRSRWVIIRNTYGELRDTTRKTFEQWVPAALGSWRETEFTFELAFNDVRAEIMFRALDRPDHVRKLLSLELTGAYINEAKEIAKPVFDLLQTRVGRYPAKKDGGASWFGIWADTNPCDTDHWIYRLFEEERPKIEVPVDPADPDGEKVLVEFERFRQPDGLAEDAENTENLPPGYYQRLMLGKDEDWINVYVRGRYGFVKEGRPVFPEYRDEVHCKLVKPIRTAQVVLGMDFGLTPAAVLGQRDPMDGQVQVFRELVSDSLGAVRFSQELARILRAEYPGRKVVGWGDPAGDQRSQVDERTPFDVVNASGLPVAPAPTNDVVRRLEAVKGLLGRLTSAARPALVISPDCPTLRKALGGAYCYARVRVAGDARFKDQPDKNAFSHVADALQYLCVGEGEDDHAIEGGNWRPQRRGAVRIQVKRSIKG